eukprot:CAMPEP_0198686076 /NCGR_PEP_ID=MMETSP1468-20131203/14459_1 /TAXON_ID=1461545 /ORGANISM="Mantoniella sp, Strain CCMP1436" /LENGTH=157 /DNA_ID=CAMNT_0044431943 /DNA_START=247 /DNA_END=716 /DNA_ORIENTATION=-
MSLSSLVAAPLCATPPLAARGHRHHRRSCVRVHAARPPSGPAGDDGKGGQPKKQRYEVKVSTPPERSLGIHTLPKNVGCGETIEVLNRYFVVDRVNYHYKLEYGKYRRDASRLYVEEATRYLLNKHLNSLLAQDPAESLGERMQEGGERRVGDVDGG